LEFGSRGKKHIERHTVIVSNLEKLNAHVVVLHPLDGGKADFHRRLLPRKIQDETEPLTRLKHAIDTQTSALARKIKQGSVV
jgi:hypothetical protein